MAALIVKILAGTIFSAYTYNILSSSTSQPPQPLSKQESDQAILTTLQERIKTVGGNIHLLSPIERSTLITWRQKIVQLDLSGTKFNLKTIQTLFTLCPHITKLTLKNCEIGDKELNSLLQLKNQLSEISLTNNYITDSGLRSFAFRNAKHIKKGCFVNNLITEQGFKDIYQTEKVPLHFQTPSKISLKLLTTKIETSGGNFSALSSDEKKLLSLSGRYITTLSFKDCTIDETQMKQTMKYLTCLETLTLSNTNMVSFPPMPRTLKTINYQYSPVTHFDFLLPATVETINFIDCGGLTSIAKSTFSQCFQLKTINFHNYCTITHLNFTLPSSIEAITFQNLYWTNIRVIDETAFSMCSHLTHLSLFYCEYLTDMNCILPASLETLELPRQGITNNLTTIDSKAFSKCSQLKTIYSHNCPALTPQKIAEIKKQCPLVQIIPERRLS